MLIKDDDGRYLSPNGRSYGIEVEPIGDKFVRVRLVAEPAIPNTMVHGLETMVPLRGKLTLRWAWPPLVLRSQAETAIERLLLRADRLEAEFGEVLRDLPAPAMADDGPKLTDADISRLADEIDERERLRLQEAGMGPAEEL